MGQSNAGAALCTSTGVTPLYTKTKAKKRETLTLKQVRNRQNNRKQSHFESSLDFSNNVIMGRNSTDAKIADAEIPVLTTAITPVIAAAQTATFATVDHDQIPVLDQPIEPSNNNIVSSKNFSLLAGALLVTVAVGAMLLSNNNRVEPTDTLNTVAHNISNGENYTGEQLLISGTTGQLLETSDVTNSETVSIDNSDVLLIENIVGLLNKERFSQDTTIQAFLDVWQQLSGATKATLNSTPWFLKFVFSLQKQSRVYLQSPDSYDSDYNIKLNGLLKLAVAVGVMDQKGIQSRVELYSSKRNELLEKLKSDIATIETAAKKNSTAGSIDGFKKRFRQRLELKQQSTSAVKPQTSEKQAGKIIRSNVPEVQPTTTPKTDKQIEKPQAGLDALSKAPLVPAVEVESLVNRFVAAYEHGDIKMLESLFSPTAKTNDKNNLAGIREDYEQLFEASTFRILNLMNMRWTSSQDYMKGTGDYEIAIAMDDAGNARTLHGKIQFVVAKVNNSLRITRLYHLER